MADSKKIENLKRRNFIKEDTLRKYLMQLEKREVVELYLQLRFDKEVNHGGKADWKRLL